MCQPIDAIKNREGVQPLHPGAQRIHEDTLSCRITLRDPKNPTCHGAGVSNIRGSGSRIAHQSDYLILKNFRSAFLPRVSMRRGFLNRSGPRKAAQDSKQSASEKGGSGPEPPIKSSGLVAAAGQVPSTALVHFPDWSQC